MLCSFSVFLLFQVAFVPVRAKHREEFNVTCTLVFGTNHVFAAKHHAETATHKRRPISVCIASSHFYSIPNSMVALELLLGFQYGHLYDKIEPDRHLTPCDHRRWPLSRSDLNTFFVVSFKAYLRYLRYPPLKSRK